MKEKLSFKNSKGHKLVGILSNPTNDKSKPIIILCHGLHSKKESRAYVGFEERFNKNKFSTFRFDLHGHGESEAKFEDVTISQACDDILCSIEFLKKAGYSKIGLIGSSFAGIAGIIAASKTNDLFVLGLRAPVSNYPEKDMKSKGPAKIKEWKEKGYIYKISVHGTKHKLNYSFFLDSKNNDGWEAAKKIKIPTIIVHGDEDELVPVEQSKKTAGIIKDCKLELMKGTDHHFSKPEDFEKCLDLIADFIIERSK